MGESIKTIGVTILYVAGVIGTLSGAIFALAKLRNLIFGPRIRLEIEPLLNNDVPRQVKFGVKVTNRSIVPRSFPNSDLGTSRKIYSSSGDLL